MRGFCSLLVAVASLGSSLGCARVPTPLDPSSSGSVGLPHRGVLKDGRELPRTGDGYAFLRDNGRRSALPRFAFAIERAAKSVREARPGGTLTIGDLSAPTGGGPALPHLSHRSGRDADLLLYLQTLDGAPAASPGFVRIGPDGLGEETDGNHGTGRYFRFDVEREWLLVRALLTDESARVQWIFIHDDLKAMLLEWARARGEPTELVWRAMQVMAQPRPGGLHDDHIHVRTACDPADVVHGCEPFGPVRPWLAIPPFLAAESDQELALAIVAPLGSLMLAEHVDVP